jgi:Holliday junction resolvasome RuvABC endonuclease subunit
MIGTVLVEPPTWNVSVQVPAVGWAVVNETKSKLKYITTLFIIQNQLEKIENDLPQLTDGSLLLNEFGVQFDS